MIVKRNINLIILISVLSCFCFVGDSITQTRKIPGSMVSNIPAGNIAATDAQGAINELDTEKSGTAHSHNLQDLGGAATDSQVPDTITVNQATNADTVDTKHFTDIQADTASQISTHTGNASAHHAKTTSFTDLIDTATDLQIPNNITIDYAATAGSATTATTATSANNADTVDTKHFTDIQADTASQISTHASNASAHHTKTTSFTDLADSATDLQIPNNITIDYATSAGSATSATSATNADTVDTKHFTDIQADTASQISTHASNTDAHHAKSHVHDGLDGSGVVAASSITNTPAGNIAATDVQAAVNELDTEKSGTAHSHNLQDLGGAATDAQVPDNITISGAITPSSVSTAAVTVASPSAEAISVTGATAPAGNTALYFLLNGKAYASYRVTYGGTINMGDGTNPLDVEISRGAADRLDLASGDSLYVTSGASYITFAATTYTVNLGVQSFKASDSNPAIVSYTNNRINPSLSDGNPDYAYAPIVLPVGAVVTQLDAWGYTAAAGDSVNVDLRRSLLNNTTSDSLAAVTYNDAGTSATTTTITNPTVSASYSYYIVTTMDCSVTTTNAQLMGVTVTYTRSNLGIL